MTSVASGKRVGLYACVFSLLCGANPAIAENVGVRFGVTPQTVGKAVQAFKTSTPESGDPLAGLDKTPSPGGPIPIPYPVINTGKEKTKS